MGKHLAGLAPEEPSRDTAPSVRGHPDQITTAIVRGLDNGREGVIAGSQDTPSSLTLDLTGIKAVPRDDPYV